MQLFPDYRTFRKKSQKGAVIPVFAEILADMETPTSVYKKVARQSPYSFLLESVEAGMSIGQYSFIGCDSKMIFRSRNRQAEIIQPHKRERFCLKVRPLVILKDLFKKIHYVRDERLPSFCGGAVGYVGYDYIRFLEAIPDRNPDELQAYDVYFVFYDVTIVFDHVKRKIQIVANVEIDDKGPHKAYEQAGKKIRDIMHRIRNQHIKSHVIRPASIFFPSVVKIDSG